MRRLEPCGCGKSRKKNKLKHGFFVLVFLLQLNLNLFPDEITPFNIDPTHILALGGRHSAYSKDVFCLFSNPALLSQIQDESFFRFGAGMTGSLEEQAALIKSFLTGSMDSNIIQPFVEKNLVHTPPELLINGPLAIAYAAKGFGAGFFNKIFVDSGLNGDKWTTNYSVDLILAAGWSHTFVNNFNHTFDAGFSIKAFSRFSLNKIIENGRETSDSGALSLVNGAALGFGALYTFYDRLSIGISCSQAPAAYITAYIGKAGKSPDFKTALPDVQAGFSVNLIRGAVLSWTLAVDFCDALALISGEKDAALLISAGMEFVFFGTAFLRAGLKDMAPCGGLGWRFGRFSVDASVYGKEYGNKAGVHTSYGFSLGFTFHNK
ncbi:MAG: hypothetical protein LBC53_09665 [Spirochaetaceae bacterium]|jgi:hypothetical protein|nr:hypothetical protein [Spirochaetaceae bacterium]